MSWTEMNIAGALARQFFNRQHLVVVPNCIWTGHESDLLVVCNDLRLIDVEIKISRADFKADAKKDKWWSRKFMGYGEPQEVFHHGHLIGKNRPSVYETTQRSWPPKVWKHYYCMPKEIYSEDLLEFIGSKSSGVLLLSEQERGAPIVITCAKRCIPNRDAAKITAAQAIDIARLASLRMWTAFDTVAAMQKKARAAA
ncbi:MAG: hypothetical protein V4718_04350 [Pseudomonadota bacterium]